jgi:NTP pyrophosphatase (non-canonical NTP hydrolase)
MKKGKSFREVVGDTRKLVKEFEKREQKKWKIEGAMIELMKQVGDLSRCVMMKEKYYLKSRDLDPKYKTIKDNIGDELYDIFFMLVRIADHYGIDLEKECEKECKYSMAIFSKEKK